MLIVGMVVVNVAIGAVMKISPKLSILVLAVMSAGFSQAVQLTYQFDTIISSSGTPGGATPWATLVLEDIATDTVRLNLTFNATSPANEFLSKLQLNYDGSLSGTPAVTVVTDVDNSYQSLTYNPNGIVDTGAIFDMTLDLATANPNRLNPGQSLVLDLNGAGLNATGFDSLSGGNKAISALLHIQGIAGGGSAKVAPVPEPGTFLALGAFGLLALRRRKK